MKHKSNKTQKQRHDKALPKVGLWVTVVAWRSDRPCKAPNARLPSSYTAPSGHGGVGLHASIVRKDHRRTHLGVGREGGATSADVCREAVEKTIPSVVIPTMVS